MQLHTLKTGKKRAKVRIGRGGKRGSFSGRGIKGQKARAGRRIRPEMRDLIMKMPKQRGHSYSGPKETLVVVNAAAIAKKFKAGDTVTPKALVAKRLVHKISGKIPAVKILNPKALPAGVIVSECSVSRSK